jgi:hypothetical protein
MNPPDPWAFGWTQLLTIIGFIITVGIAGIGFRTFGRWKREKLEEKRIEIAFDMLAIAYEARFIFAHIRGPMAYPHEWTDMPEAVSETADQRTARGSFYATLSRIAANKDISRGFGSFSRVVWRCLELKSQTCSCWCIERGER